MTKKSIFDLPTGPDQIVLYQKNIEAICSSEAEVRERTVIHELGHYFGMDENQLKDVSLSSLESVAVVDDNTATHSRTIDQVSGVVAQYIATQHERYASRAVPLSAQQKAAMDGFFSSQHLDGTRLLVSQNERVTGVAMAPQSPDYLWP